MKKQYIKPNAEIMMLETQGVMASSIRINDEETVNVSRSRNFWGIDEE